MKSFKKNALLITLAALVICCSILLLGISLAAKLNDVKNYWSEFNHSSTRASQQLHKIHQHFGYGGSIHQFKNYVLRQQPEDFEHLQNSFNELKKALISYEHYTSTDAEKNALQVIAGVVQKYEKSAVVAQKLIEQGISPQELDTHVRVNDAPALLAFTTLNNAANIRTYNIESGTTLAFESIIDHLFWGVLIVPIFSVFALFLISVLRKLTLSNRQLSEANTSMDTLFEAVPDALLTCNPDGRLLRVNKEAIKLFGYPEEELLNLTIEELMPDRYRGAHHQHRNQYFHKPTTRAMEKSGILYVKTKSGKEVPVEINLSHIVEDGGYVAVATVRDVSTRKIQEAEIKASQKRLAEAQRIAKLGSWSIDFCSGATLWSDEVYQILHLDKEKVSPSLQLYLSTSSRSETDELEQILSSSDTQIDQYRLIRKIQNADGDISHVREEGELYRDENGNLTNAVGTIRDITEAVQTREKLEQAAVVFEHTSDAVMITDQNRNIIAINKAYADITGYSEDEVLNQDAGFSKSGQHSAEFYQEMNEALLQTGSWEGEIWDRRKDGEIYPKRLSITSVYNSRGALLYYVGVFSDISHIKSTEDQLRHLALHDSLTGLPNRLSFNQKLDHAIKHADRIQQNVAVLFLDLDRFKTINDSLGHPVGDSLLNEVATRLKSCLRNDDTIARLGGDEFTIIMEEIRIPEDAAKVAEKITEALSAPVEIEGHQFYITTSIGISLYPEDGESVTDLVKNADAAMYRAKEAGRNCYEFYSSELAATAVARLELEGELRQAIKNQEFSLHYQPQFNIQSGAIIGAEALIRWQHPERGLVPPDMFIPIAEETGLINQIGELALFKACRQLMNWRSKGFNLPKVSVNVAGKQIISGQIINQVNDALATTGLSPESLEIELTETTLMQQTEKTIATLNQLRELGVTISIDDFGTGYSSLSYLKTLPIQTIKIDRSFVQDIPTDSNDVAITRAIIALSKTLQLSVIAEGLESEQQQTFLIKENCLQAQGFLFSRPLPSEQFYSRYHDHQLPSNMDQMEAAELLLETPFKGPLN
ncbi:EAL domain-containing protein [Neptuniibacter sp.]|uniref:sensor domain-containing protein n=1 Tax=Neptuniibacter sp. TaxID=1962643 RepID=UPI00261C651A|nr:EAL domain-containing protein [Neptuniibacter sp.]MCP4596600.1 EAL domain-containing protein [Neptuniibacter sp.]